jgi:hypothetical protein
VNKNNETIILPPRFVNVDSSDCGTSPATRRYSISESEYDTDYSPLAAARVALANEAIHRRAGSNATQDLGSPCEHSGEELYSSSYDDAMGGSSGDDTDKYEKYINKSIERYLEFGSSSEDKDNKGDDTDIIPSSQPSTSSFAIDPEEMLSKFTQIPVTAFRRRQLEHQYQMRNHVITQDAYKDNGRITKSYNNARVNSSLTPTRRRKSTDMTGRKSTPDSRSIQ